MPLREIGQTSKLLLIEKFTDSDKDLRTILANEDMPAEELYERIREDLEVSSFAEFAKKFMPQIWEWCEQSDDPLCPVRFCYSVTRPPAGKHAHSMELPEQEFYKLVMRLYDDKAKSGNSNLEFDYSEVEKMLSPKSVMENAMNLRKDLEYNIRRYLALDDSQKGEKNRYYESAMHVREKIIDQYKDSFTGRVKLALADVEKRLEIEEKNQQEEEYMPADGQNVYRIGFDDTGELIRIPVLDTGEDISAKAGTEKDDIPERIAQIVARDFDEFSNDKSSFVRDLVISNYSGTDLIRAERAELVKKRDQYKTVYKNSQEQFIRAVSAVIEKVLDVKIFFDHAAKSDGTLNAPVIVANCKADELLNNETVKGRFQRLVRGWGKQRGSDRVWFAILPAIGDAEFLDNVVVESEERDIFDSLSAYSGGDKDVKTSTGESLIGLGTAKTMLNILKEGKVITFFNFKAGEQTGFIRLNAEKIKTYRAKLKALDGNSYAVFAYPNFTVLPKKNTNISIGMITRGGVEQKEYLEIPGIYADASYVAAGIVVATQTPECLKKNGLPLANYPNNPCVRFDLEDRDNRYTMLTRMNRENKSLWEEGVEDEIMKDGFGFSFCGNIAYYKNQPVKNTYVYTARTMGQTDDKKYKSICTRLTQDFITQYLSLRYNGRVTEKDINEFIENIANKWRKEAESNKSARDNILKEGEKVEYDKDMEKICIHFLKITEPVVIEDIVMED